MDPMELRIAVSAAALAVAGLVIAGLCAMALGTARASVKWPVAGRRPKRTLPRQLGVVAGVVVVAGAAGLGASISPLRDVVGWLPPAVGAALITLAVVGYASVKLASKIELSALINSPSPGAGGPHTATPPHPVQPSVADRLHGGDEFAYGQPYPGVVSQPDGRHDQPSSTVPSPSSSQEVVASHTAPVGVHTTTPPWETPANDDPVSVTANETQAIADLLSDAAPGWVYVDEGDNWYMVVSHGAHRGLVRLSDFALAEETDLVGNVHVGGSVDITVWPVDDESQQTDEHEHEHEHDEQGR